VITPSEYYSMIAEKEQVKTERLRKQYLELKAMFEPEAGSAGSKVGSDEI
jgi:hypothetical protein